MQILNETEKINNSLLKLKNEDICQENISQTTLVVKQLEDFIFSTIL